MNKKCKSGLEAVISDLDGTLVRVSDEYCKQLFEEVFKKLNLIGNDEHLDEKIAADLFYSLKREHMIEEMYAKKSMNFEKERFWNAYHIVEKSKDFLEKRIMSLKVYDDARILKHFFEKGAKIGIITQSQKEVAFAEIKKIEKEIDLKINKNYVIHNSSYDFMKPDYRVLEKLIERMKVQENIVYIGDSETDLLLIKNFKDNSRSKNINITSFLVFREYFKSNEQELLKNFLSYNINFFGIYDLNELKEKMTELFDLS
jgi:phosphoglycolate phosphatase-like HAD superfamily hydrolase